MSLFETTALTASGVSEDSQTAGAVKLRANVLELTQVAENAVLRPAEPGGLPHDLRAALAARIARLCGQTDLAEKYLAGARARAALADPGSESADAGLGALIAFVDKVAARTASMTAEDVSGLQQAGYSDADVVRICELNAFVAYQARLIAGLRLMNGKTP
ncbi:MAG: hypothetical protein HKP29_13615 [Silicimonas sp.]|nr:hypothetical protein [Silicimonas sp.]